jgi:uncharacterized UBP type Zn finger protein
MQSRSADAAGSSAQPRCQACVEMGDSWVHLRMCLHCGLIGCCDDSKNRHASRHARNARHPVICSAEPGERWLWCFAHDRQVG